MENIIFNEDCFDRFKHIPDRSIQLVCVDLPYAQTALKWDCALDLGKMWIELKRIGKENCQYVFFCNTKFGYDLITSNRNWFHYDIVWEKTNAVGFLSAKYQPLKAHEMIYIFRNNKKPKGLEWIYNPQMTPGKPYRKVKTGRKNPCVYGVDTGFHIENITGDRHPRSVVEFFKPKYRLHATEKPVALCEWLIKTYSNEGDVVLDFTMGSGSTIIGCINTKRKYIGIEKDEKIFLSAKKRIEDQDMMQKK
jgi:site-specific DNA-methyltransferase (adenine-specific)